MKFLFLIMVLVLGCTKENGHKDTLTISLPGEITTLDPANCYDSVCYVPVAQVYETLYEIEYLKRPYSLRPLLAKSFPAISKDRLVYSIPIKKGIKYHPSDLLPGGRTVKAQDFVNQIKRLAFAPTKSTGWWLLEGKVKGLNEWRQTVGSDLTKFFSEPIPGIRAPDDETLEIELLKPYPQLLFVLSMNFTSPVPEEMIKATGNDLSQKHAGTGAYVIQSFNLSQEVILKKNPEYATSTYPAEGDRSSNDQGLLKDAGAKLPFVENVKLTVIKEAQTDWLNFLKKKIDLINLTKDHYQVALTADGKLKPEVIKDNIQLQASPTLIYWWIQFNMKDPVLGKNLNLRKAIAHGVNIDKYLELFTYNVAQKANSIYPPGIPGYSPSADLPYRYDLALARDFLAKAGYPGGKGLPRLTFALRGTDTRRRQMGEFIQKELRVLGMEVDIQGYNFPAFLDKSRKGQLQFWQGGWILDYPDAENVLQLLNSANLPPGPNSSQYENPAFDELFNRLRYLEDGQEKSELMVRMEKMVNDDLPWIMQYYTRNYILIHDHVKNFRYSDIIYNNLKYLKLSPDK